MVKVKAVGLYGKHQARARGLVADQDRAGAADAVLAPEVDAAELELLAQHVGRAAVRGSTWTLTARPLTVSSTVRSSLAAVTLMLHLPARSRAAVPDV